jgi:hypothetical protein
MTFPEDVEKNAHLFLSSKRLKREWFSVSPMDAAVAVCIAAGLDGNFIAAISRHRAMRAMTVTLRCKHSSNPVVPRLT